MEDVTVAIIAGGKSVRMGRDKRFVPLHGKPMLAHVVERVQHLRLPVIIVANDPQPFAPFGLPVLGDVLPDAGSLGGVYSAIVHSATPYTLCVACDMPFLNVDLLAALLAKRERAAAVVPRVGEYAEALHAVYSRACLPLMRQLIEQKRLRIGQIFGQVETCFVAEAELRRYDPNLMSLLNVNTPDALAQAEALLAGQTVSRT